MEGRNLPVMDPTGKSDPYCVVIVGNQEQRTVVQYSTVFPQWHETLQFEVSGVPQLMQNEPGNNTLSISLFSAYVSFTCTTRLVYNVDITSFVFIIVGKFTNSWDRIRRDCQ